MNQGLHHLPQSQILPFLAQVRRILRPGGLLIVREHNARPYLEPKVSDVSSPKNKTFISDVQLLEG